MIVSDILFILLASTVTTVFLILALAIIDRFIG